MLFQSFVLRSSSNIGQVMSKAKVVAAQTYIKQGTPHLSNSNSEHTNLTSPLALSTLEAFIPIHEKSPGTSHKLGLCKIPPRLRHRRFNFRVRRNDWWYL